MAQNPDFKPVMLKNVELQYPKLNGTYRFNNAKKQSEPCEPTVTNAAWSTAWKMAEKDAKSLFKELKAHYEDCRSRNKKLPDFTKVFGMKKNDDGTVSFQAKKKGTNSEGKINKPPTVIDGMKNAVTNLDFWTGTTANMRVTAFASVDPDGVGGISMILDVVQIINPVYGGTNLDDFDSFDAPPAGGAGSAAADDDPFDTPAPKATGRKPPAAHFVADDSEF